MSSLALLSPSLVLFLTSLTYLQQLGMHLMEPVLMGLEKHAARL